MVPILAKQALARKCEFSNARMTGNYECAYALGVVSGALAIPKEENAANLALENSHLRASACLANIGTIMH